MNDDPIKKLLRDADSMAGAGPAGHDDLPGRVRGAIRRGRGAKSILLGGLAVFMIVFAGVLICRGLLGEDQSAGEARVARTPEDIDPTRLRAEIDDLQAEIRVRQAVVDRLLLLERGREARVRLAAIPDRGDPRDAIDRHTDRAAEIMVLHASRLRHRLGRTDSAIIEYQRVIALFPRSPWASVARQEIQTLKTNENKETRHEKRNPNTVYLCGPVERDLLPLGANG